MSLRVEPEGDAHHPASSPTSVGRAQHPLLIAIRQVVWGGTAWRILEKYTLCNHHRSAASERMGVADTNSAAARRRFYDQSRLRGGGEISM